MTGMPVRSSSRNKRLAAVVSTASLKRTGSYMSGIRSRRDCWLASIAIRLQRSMRFSAAFSRPLSLRSARTNFIRSHAEFRRLFQQKFQTIELEERDQQLDRNFGSRIGQAVEHSKLHLGFPDRLDFGKIKRVVVGDLIDLAGLDPQHLCEVPRFIARDFRAGIPHLRHEESASGHLEQAIEWWARRDSNPGPPRCKRGALTN